MTILMNNRMAASLLVPPLYGLGAGGGVLSSIWLCTGIPPTDAQVDSLTKANYASQSFVSDNKSVVITGLSLAAAYQVGPPVLFYQHTAGVKGTSTKAGVLSWGVLISAQGNISIADVGLANSGAVIQVDTLNVAVNTVVNVLGMSIRVGRQ